MTVLVLHRFLDILMISNSPASTIPFHTIQGQHLKGELITSETLLCFTSIHFEPLMLALFNRLRALQFGLEGSFCASGFPEFVTSDPGGLWWFAPVGFSTSLFWLFSSLGAGTRSLQNVNWNSQCMILRWYQRQSLQAQLPASSMKIVKTILIWIII